MADRLEELNDAHGRGILSALTECFPAGDRRRYRTLSRAMYRDQFASGVVYARRELGAPSMAVWAGVEKRGKAA